MAIWLTHDPARLQHNRYPEIDRHTVLVRGRTYLVNVGVGIDRPTDLVDPDTPPVDPILPPTPNTLHRLTVAVFSETVTVLDEPAKELALGMFGAAPIELPSGAEVLAGQNEHG